MMLAMQSDKFAPRIITFPTKVTNYQLMNISPEHILIQQNMLIYALFIDCCKSHLRAFVAKPTSVPGFGGSANFGNVRILKAPVFESPPFTVLTFWP